MVVAVAEAVAASEMTTEVGEATPTMKAPWGIPAAALIGAPMSLALKLAPEAVTVVVELVTTVTDRGVEVDNPLRTVRVTPVEELVAAEDMTTSVGLLYWIIRAPGGIPVPEISDPSSLFEKPAVAEVTVVDELVTAPSVTCRRNARRSAKSEVSTA